MDDEIKRLLDLEETGRERWVNHLRLAILALFLLTFMVFYLRSERHYTAGYVILVDFLSLFGYGIFLEVLLRRGCQHPALKYVSFAADMTCISVMVACSIFLSRGADPYGWLASVCGYFLFIALTSLRFSPRLCIFLGVTAAGQFLLINQIAQALAGKSFPGPQQATTALLMIGTGLVLAISARNARRLVVRVGLAEREKAHLAVVAAATRELAITDELTGLPNRRHFQEEAQRLFSHAKRNQEPVTVTMIDLDGFKAINDQFGHHLGDEVLRHVASVLKRNTRPTDFLARLGGDEFAILLYGANSVEARMIAERLCEKVREAPVLVGGARSGRQPTLSIGLASFPVNGGDLASLLAAADKALYAAKDLGKDRVAFV